MFPRVYLLLAALLLLSICCAKSESQVAAPPDAASDLTNAEASARRAAYDTLFKQNVDLTERLIAQFDATANDSDRHYGSARYWTIMALAHWRVERAVPKLVEAIPYQIDPATYPGGGERRTLSMCYPAAVALSRIGGKDMVRSVLSRGEGGKDVELCAWILKDNLGRELALAAVKLWMERATNKAYLRDMQTLLEKDQEILPWN